MQKKILSMLIAVLLIVSALPMTLSVSAADVASGYVPVANWKRALRTAEDTTSGASGYSSELTTLDGMDVFTVTASGSTPSAVVVYITNNGSTQRLITPDGNTITFDANYAYVPYYYSVPAGTAGVATGDRLKLNVWYSESGGMYGQCVADNVIVQNKWDVAVFPLYKSETTPLYQNLGFKARREAQKKYPANWSVSIFDSISGNIGLKTGESISFTGIDVYENIDSFDVNTVTFWEDDTMATEAGNAEVSKYGSYTMPTADDAGLVIPDGFSFLAWKDLATDKQYAPGDSYVNVSGADVNFAPVLIGSTTYTISFKKADGTVVADPIEKALGESFEMPAFTAEPDRNTTFTGWVDTSTGTLYNPGDTYTVTAAADVTINAKFQNYIVNNLSIDSYYNNSFRSIYYERATNNLNYDMPDYSGFGKYKVTKDGISTMKIVANEGGKNVPTIADYCDGGQGGSNLATTNLNYLYIPYYYEVPEGQTGAFTGKAAFGMHYWKVRKADGGIEEGYRSPFSDTEFAQNRWGLIKIDFKNNTTPGGIQTTGNGYVWYGGYVDGRLGTSTFNLFARKLDDAGTGYVIDDTAQMAAGEAIYFGDFYYSAAEHERLVTIYNDAAKTDIASAELYKDAEVITLPAAPATIPANATFAGWKDNSTGVIYPAGAEYEVVTFSDVDITPEFAYETSVTFKANGAVVHNYTWNSFSKYTFPSAPAVSENETFVGWVKEGDTSTVYSADTEYTYSETSDTVYVALIVEKGTVYLDTVNGSDSNNGFAPGAAFKTLEKAMETLPAAGETKTIYFTGSIKNINLASSYDGLVKIVGYGSADLQITMYQAIQAFNGNVSFENITVTWPSTEKQAYIANNEVTFNGTPGLGYVMLAPEGNELTKDTTLNLNNASGTGILFGRNFRTNAVSMTGNVNVNLNASSANLYIAPYYSLYDVTVDGKLRVYADNASTIGLIAFARAGVKTTFNSIEVLLVNGSELTGIESIDTTAHILQAEDGIVLNYTDTVGTYEVSGIPEGKVAVAYNCATNAAAYKVTGSTITLPVGSYKVVAVDAFEDILDMLSAPEKDGEAFISWNVGTDAITANTVNVNDHVTFVGAQIRTSGTQALRFIVDKKSALATAMTGATIVEYGTVVLPTELLGSSSLVIGGTYNYNDVDYQSSKVAGEKTFKINSDGIWYTVAITGIESNATKLARDYTVRAYITYTDAYGVAHTVYSDTYNNSAYNVAKAAIAAGIESQEVLNYLQTNIVDVVDAANA